MDQRRKRQYENAVQYDAEERGEAPPKDFAIPKSANQRTEGLANDAVVDKFGARDYSGMKLHDDHEKRPLWLSIDGHIFLESFSPMYKAAHDFLVTVAEVSIFS